MQDLNIIDLPLQGANYTWSRDEDSIQASKFDWFLVSSEWNDTFIYIKQIALPKVALAQRPILLEMVTGKPIHPISNLKICGCKRKDSWTKLRNGGTTTLLGHSSFFVAKTEKLMAS